jgi:integrase
VRGALRARHYSLRTEEAYLRWIRQYILFFDRRHPSELGAKEVSAFVTHLAAGRQVAASTQSQALSALLFLYREVLDLPIEWVDDVERAKAPKRLPAVFTRGEVRAVLSRLRGGAWLMASLLYGSGLRLMECVRLRVKDVDFARLRLTARDGKGREGPRRRAPLAARRAAARADGEGEGAARGGLARRLGPRLPAARAGQEVPERREGVVLAVRLPGLEAVG